MGLTIQLGARRKGSLVLIAEGPKSSFEPGGDGTMLSIVAVKCTDEEKAKRFMEVIGAAIKDCCTPGDSLFSPEDQDQFEAWMEDKNLAGVRAKGNC